MKKHICKKDIKPDGVYKVEAYIKGEILDYGTMTGADVLAVLGTAKRNDEISDKYNVNQYSTKKVTKVYWIEEA